LRRSHEDLRDAQLQLIQTEKLESVGRLAAGVAHEVKNPLAIILAGVETLRQRLSDGDARIQAVLRDIEDAVTRADTVLRGLVDFSASKELAPSLEDVNAIIEKAALLVKHELDKAHVALTTALTDDVPLLKLDRTKIEQVLVNVFMNAIQAMPGGGSLAVRTSARTLGEAGGEVGRRRTDRFRVGQTVVLIEVDDTGTGIPEAQLKKVFDPFFTTKPTGTGTGLGLTVCQKIIDLHGGLIDLANRPEGGTRVTVMLGV